MKGALIPAFAESQEAMNFEFVAVSDIWSKRREEAVGYIRSLLWKLPTSSFDAAFSNQD